MFVVPVRAQVVGELVNAGGQQGNLHFGRTGVAFVTGEVLHDCRFFFFLDWHVRPLIGVAGRAGPVARRSIL
jgi:hypothetical protein